MKIDQDEFNKFIDGEVDFVYAHMMELRKRALDFHAKYCVSSPEDQKKCGDYFLKIFLEAVDSGLVAKKEEEKLKSELRKRVN